MGVPILWETPVCQEAKSKQHKSICVYVYKYVYIYACIHINKASQNPSVCRVDCIQQEQSGRDTDFG